MFYGYYSFSTSIGFHDPAACESFDHGHHEKYLTGTSKKDSLCMDSI